MKIGCLQFSPQVGDVANNLNRADAVLSRADPMELDSLDLLVLPEMAFSGYNFKSLDQIMPYLEPSGSGISALWARTTALKYGCVVGVGYPEKVDSSHQTRASGPKYYNSLIMVNGDGETLVNYRKTFLYYTDTTWAQEGSGFFGGKLDGLGQVAMGICMDINPYKFEAPWNAYEFGFHIIEVKANLVILSMAWLTFENRSTFTPFAQEPDMDTISYWVQRIEPVIRSNQTDEIIVVFCNRCGIEDDVVYAGSSTVVGVKNGEVSVYGLLGRGVKELLIVDTDTSPFAKFVSKAEIETVLEEALPSPQMPPAKASPSQVSPSQVSPAKLSPGSERLGRLAETEEPESPTSSLRTSSSQGGTSCSAATRTSSGSLPTAEIAPPRPTMRETEASNCRLSPEKSEVLATSTTHISSAELSSAHQRGARFSSDDNRPYSYSRGRTGRDGNIPRSLSGMLNTPTNLRSPLTAPRPKLAISTSPSSLFALPRTTYSRGNQLGNFIKSPDLYTPPITAFDETPVTAFGEAPMTALDEPPVTAFDCMTTLDEAPMTAFDDVPMSSLDNFRYHWRRPSAFPPLSAQLITPEEPVWPDLHMKTPTRDPLPRPASRTEVKAPPRPPSRVEAKPTPRPRSRAEVKLPSRPPSKAEMKAPPRFPNRIDTNLTSEPKKWMKVDAGDLKALTAAVRDAGFITEKEVPLRPVSPKSQHASREASREASRASSRNPSREPSRSRNPSKSGSRCASRSQSREPNREPSRNRAQSRNVSREPSRTREDEDSSPIDSPRSLRAESSQVAGRTRSSRAQSASPARHHARADGGRDLEGHWAAKSLLSSFKEPIPIAASPSVLKTSFDESEMWMPPKPTSRPGHSRSKSASTFIPSAQRRPSIASENNRITTDFSTLWSTRGREPTRRAVGISPVEPRGRPEEPPTVAHIARRDPPGNPSLDSLPPGIRAFMITEDEAFLGHALARAETWRQKREPRQNLSASRMREVSTISPVEAPVSRRSSSESRVRVGPPVGKVFEMVAPTFFI